MQPGRYYFRCWTSPTFAYAEFDVEVAERGLVVAVLDLDVILRGPDGTILARVAHD